MTGVRSHNAHVSEHRVEQLGKSPVCIVRPDPGHPVILSHLFVTDPGQDAIKLIQGTVSYPERTFTLFSLLYANGRTQLFR